MESYNYVFLGGINNSYVFETSKGIVYEIKFKPSSYLFSENEVFSKLIYEFVIEVAINDTGKSPSFDAQVSETIALIFKEFFIKNSYNVCLYICDSSDGKEDIRRKKFNDWYYKYENGMFIKLDEALIDSNKKIFPISLIIYNKNPYAKEIASAFIQLALDNKSEK